MKLVTKILPVLVTALLLASPGFAQTGNLTGKVVDTDGKPLNGVTISIDRQGISGHFEVKTDKSGNYVHAGLPTGNYKVSVLKDGKPLMALDGRVQFGQDNKLDFDLKDAGKAAAAAANSNANIEEQRKKIAEEKAKNEATKAAFENARTAMAAKNYDEAIRLFSEAAKNDPTQHVIYANLADADAQAKKYDDAAAAYNKAIELKPDEAGYYNNLGIVLANQGKIDDATQKLQKAAELNPAGAGQAYYNLGAVLTNKGKTKDAGDAFKKAIELNPNMGPAYYQLGISYFGAPDTIPQAIPVLEKFIQIQTALPEAQQTPQVKSDIEAAKQLIAAAQASAPTGYQSEKGKADAAKAKKK
ncbi:MAG TPA: tetratricopeptide repeat protein [Terriglobia bacterium]|jgi:tetratricopeptide (TPR) repeat protein